MSGCDPGCPPAQPGPRGARGPAGPQGPPGPAGPAGDAITIQDEGILIGTTSILNFVGAGVTATLDAPNDRINVTIPGGGAGGDCWTCAAGLTQLATITDDVAIGAAAMFGTEKVRIVGDLRTEGDTLTTGTVFGNNVTATLTVFASDVQATVFVAIGADPADTGALRLSNNEGIFSEAGPAGTDVGMFRVNPTEQIEYGIVGNLPTAHVWDVAAAGFYSWTVASAAVAVTGDFRVRHGWALVGRNTINTVDIPVIDVGSTTADIVTVGSSVVQTQLRGSTSGGVRIVLAGTERARFITTSVDFNSGTNANYEIRGNTEPMIGLNIAAAGVRNIAFFNNGTAAMNGMDGGFFEPDSIAAPAGNPTAGIYRYGVAGAGVGRGSGGTITTYIPA